MSERYYETGEEKLARVVSYLAAGETDPARVASERGIGIGATLAFLAETVGTVELATEVARGLLANGEGPRTLEQALRLGLAAYARYERAELARAGGVTATTEEAAIREYVLELRDSDLTVLLEAVGERFRETDARLDPKGGER